MKARDKQIENLDEYESQRKFQQQKKGAINKRKIWIISFHTRKTRKQEMDEPFFFKPEGETEQNCIFKSMMHE